MKVHCKIKSLETGIFFISCFQETTDRDNQTNNKYYEKFAVFKNACLNFFQNIENYQQELMSLMTDNFQLIQA
jgi:hypothetical protein